jgi:hypothetical protein
MPRCSSTTSLHCLQAFFDGEPSCSPAAFAGGDDVAMRIVSLALEAQASAATGAERHFPNLGDAVYGLRKRISPKTAKRLSVLNDAYCFIKHLTESWGIELLTDLQAELTPIEAQVFVKEVVVVSGNGRSSSPITPIGDEDVALQIKGDWRTLPCGGRTVCPFHLKQAVDELALYKFRCDAQTQTVDDLEVLSVVGSQCVTASIEPQTAATSMEHYSVQLNI